MGQVLLGLDGLSRRASSWFPALPGIKITGDKEEDDNVTEINIITTILGVVLEHIVVYTALLIVKFLFVLLQISLPILSNEIFSISDSERFV